MSAHEHQVGPVSKRRPKPKVIYFVQGTSWSYISDDHKQVTRELAGTVGVRVFEYHFAKELPPSGVSKNVPVPPHTDQAPERK